MTDISGSNAPMLTISDLHVGVGDKPILNGINLTINAGEVHAIMGPNGSGKSTLANVLAGNPIYKVTAGQVQYEGKDLLKMEVDVRAKEGVFLAFQYPVELPGVRYWQFIKSSVDSIRMHRGLSELGIKEFDKIFEDSSNLIEIDPVLLKRSVNEGFSGGEKKRAEMLQLLVLNPKLALLDETDSGLDIDALKTVAKGINEYRNKSNAVVLVTHYQRLLNYITPDMVHVLIDGKIVKSGGKDLALELESKGYDWVREITDTKAVGTDT